MPDPILFWNQIALEANRVSHTRFIDTGLDEQVGPTRSSRALAIVHLAMYDALALVTNAGGANPPLPVYTPNVPVPGGNVNVDLAVAAAAHETLSSLYPSQKPFFDTVLDSVGDMRPNVSDDLGRDVASALLAHRADDPGAGSCGHQPLPDRGRHRPDPDNPGQGFHGAFYGSARRFAVTQRFQLAKPPFDNAEYREALREVRVLGIAPELMGTLPPQYVGRTPDQTLIGIFWANDGMAEVGTPPRQYNQIVREIVRNVPNPQTNVVNTSLENARLFAFVNVAMADAGILAWEQKYKHDLWRPVVGIREHDRSMGPGATLADNSLVADSDPAWLPLGAPGPTVSARMSRHRSPPIPPDTPPSAPPSTLLACSTARGVDSRTKRWGVTICSKISPSSPMSTTASPRITRARSGPATCAAFPTVCGR